jgi:hypothetical protein
LTGRARSDRVGDPVSNRRGDPAGHVAGHQLDLLAARFAELVKERLDGLAITASRSPRQPAAVVIDDGQIALALAMGYLIDPDPAQAIEQVCLALSLGSDAPISSATAIFDTC